MVIKLTTLRKIACLSVLACLSATSFAQRSSELSADFPDSRIMAVQAKVEKLFDAGEYERAFFIYRNELSPLGDKYAHYMVGFMYHTGLGVEHDPVAAAAWYQLSAERDTREFVVVRDRYLHLIDEDDAAEARAQYRELRLKYSDLAVLLSSIKRNVKELESRTGSRIRSQASSVTVIENSSSRSSTGPDYYEDIRKKLEARMMLLKEIGDFQDMETDADRINVHDLEQRVLQFIEVDVE
jgi:TPR repeat protein